MLLCAAAASGYYPFVHYTASSAPYGAAPEKFDLNALPGKTVFYYVSSRGPELLAPGDSFASILSQIRMAARVWNSAGSSELRFEFGGFSAEGAAQSTPGVDVYFGEVELPPGVVALGGPTSRASLISNDGEAFVPITRSILVLGNDLSQRPSYSDAFFLTVVHELGHALGLQHTLTSAAMSTDVTRSVSRARPLTPDDIAGISLLYPAAGYASRTGVISGRVTLGGEGVHLASVVALDPAGGAVSALSDPDGSYSIRGLAPGQYYLYAHPLPPALQAGLGPADIVLPLDPEGKPVAAGPLFETVFYPGVKDVAEASIVTVKAGRETGGIDFPVQGRGALDLHSVTTYSFPGNYAVKPAFINVNASRKWLVAYGDGLLSNGSPAAGLAARVIGNGAAVLDDGLKAYAPDTRFLQVNFGFNPFAGDGPRHMVFTKDGNIFVLPAAFHLVRSQPPAVASVTPALDGDGRPVALVAGSNLTAASRVLFDGYPAAVRSLDESTGVLTVEPPVGASGHRAVVNVLDSNGQDSLFLNPSAPAAYTYGESPAPSVAITPASLPAGAESMVEITGSDTAFAAGETVAGFGSSDVAVRGVWVLGPDRMLANVHVAAGAAQMAVPLSVATDFQTAVLPQALQILPANPSVPIVNPQAVNPASGQPSVYAGGAASIMVSQLPAGADAASISISVDDSPARVLAADNGAVTFELPAGLQLGPAVLRLSAGGVAASPVVIVIDEPPPVIQAVTDLNGAAVDAARPAAPGDVLVITVTGIAGDGVLSDPSQLVINIGGVEHKAVAITALKSLAGAYEVRLILGEVAPASDVPVTVGVGHRVSLPVSIPVKAAG